jgi:dihydrofolate reductase
MMRTLIYSMSVSLDGFTAGPGGEIDWTAPDEELFRFHNEQTRELGAQLSGRGLYEDMLPWETAGQTRSDPNELEFARLWSAIPKVVFSTTLEKVEGNARLATGDIADEIARLPTLPGKEVASVGGPRFAAALIRRDLIDEYRQFVWPIVLGGGTPYFPPLAKKLDLELAETRAFGSGVVCLRYRRAGRSGASPAR